MVLGPTNGLRASHLAAICSLPRLESLHLFRKQLPPGSHAELRRLPASLRALTITWVHGGSPPNSSGNLVGLEYGASNHGLEEAIAAACELRQLERLEFDGCQGIPASSLAGMADMHALRTLRLARCGRLDADAVAALALAPALVALRLSETEVDSTTRLRSLGCVESVDMGAAACVVHLVDGAAMLARGLQANRTLRRLGLSGRGTELDALAQAAPNLHALRELTLHAVPASRAKALAALARLPESCRDLRVTLVCDAPDALAGAVEAAVAALGPRLRALGVVGAGEDQPWLSAGGALPPALPAETLVALKSLEGTLRDVRLQAVSVPGAVALLCTVGGVERLDLEDVHVGAEPATTLDANVFTQLQHLRIVGADARVLIRALRPALQNCRRLVQCVLQCDRLEDADVVALSSASKLQAAALVGTAPGRGLTLAGLDRLLQTCRRLRRLALDVTWNRDKGLAALLDRVPHTLAHVTDCPLELDERLDADSLGRLEPFCPPGRLP